MSFKSLCVGAAFALSATVLPQVSVADDATLLAEIDNSEEYIYVSALGNLEFFNAQKYGWKVAGDAFGVETTYVGPPDADIPAMVAALDGAIAKRPAGIAVWGFNDALTPSINRAASAGIPIVTVLGDLPNSNRLGYIGSYQYDLGFVGGQGLTKALDNEGKVAVLTLPGLDMFDQREQGFRDAFEGTGLEVVAVGDTKADMVTSINTAKDILVRQPDLNAFVATDSVGAMGAATAIKELGRTGEVLVIGMDRNSDVLERIKDGTVTASVAQGDVQMGYWALAALITANHANVPLTTDNKAAGAQFLPTNIFTGANFIDQSNVDFYLGANDQYSNF
ncbi:MAG: substrate-binding domain-containing protein [Pseudomonadota bacterium]|nr:substrate-binding domain-containing protein [Pseudomonadota bacterium]